MVSDICMNVTYGRRACETGSGRSYGLVAFADAAWFFALTVVIWTLGEMLQSPSNAATVAALSPPMLRGRYQGLNSLNWSAGTALAPVLGGLTQEHLGDRVAPGRASPGQASAGRCRSSGGRALARLTGRGPCGARIFWTSYC